MQMDESSIKKSYSNILDKCWTQVLFEAKLDVACCFVDHMKNRISNVKSIEIPPKNEEKNLQALLIICYDAKIYSGAIYLGHSVENRLKRSSLIILTMYNQG